MRVWRLSVCLSRTSGLTREQRGLGRLKLAQTHVTRTPLSRSKGQRSTCRGRGHIVAASCTACYYRLWLRSTAAPILWCVYHGVCICVCACGCVGLWVCVSTIKRILLITWNLADIVPKRIYFGFKRSRVRLGLGALHKKSRRQLVSAGSAHSFYSLLFSRVSVQCMQSAILLWHFCLSVCLSNAGNVSKRRDNVKLFWRYARASF